MKRYLFNFLLFVVVITSIKCSTDDSNEIKSERKLVLKTTQIADTPIVYNYDTSGRFINIEDTISVFPEVVRLRESVYNKNGQKVRDIFRREKDFIAGKIQYIYNTEDQITKIVRSSFNVFSLLPKITTSTLTYNDNQIVSISNIDKKNLYKMIYTFRDNTYQNLERFEAFDYESNDLVFEETYQYSPNGNLIANEVLTGEDDFNKSKSFIYDDKINPLSEGSENHYLDLLRNPAPASLVSRLIPLSTNNSLTSIIEGAEIAFEYNAKSYPIVKTTIYKDDRKDILLFSYY
ncbi:hypothetical protein NBT05_02865 [Aquimarina sp. ERC-38]|uniref:hypothetical protein n=1 Tax=Aquimarina sp. ERC-38 TaxID=2949996 RepID=UPI0022482FF5|nr:hypothetical protein [Aquimarina sp. ERC-38]UZO81422.1 hypothetical protein NBT05_02865 [Aquimarina sp. ERC-38]